MKTQPGHVKDMYKRMAELEPKHMAWIAEWAIEKCSEQIEKAETELVRHLALADQPLCTKWGAVQADRDDRKSELHDSLWQYRKVHAFLLAVKDEIGSRHAEQFAAAVVEMMRGRKS